MYRPHGRPGEDGGWDIEKCIKQACGHHLFRITFFYAEKRNESERVRQRGGPFYRDSAGTREYKRREKEEEPGESEHKAAHSRSSGGQEGAGGGQHVSPGRFSPHQHSDPLYSHRTQGGSPSVKP